MIGKYGGGIRTWWISRYGGKPEGVDR